MAGYRDKVRGIKKKEVRLLRIVVFVLAILSRDGFSEVAWEKEVEEGESAGHYELVPDFTLLKARSRDEHQQLGGRAPYFAHYRKGRLELVFIAARHEPRMGSPTHRLIKSVIKGFAPAFVITEGLCSDEGVSPRGLLQDARGMKLSGNLPEPLYAALVAHDHGIPFIGGEPPPSVTTQALRNEGNDEDALGFLVVRHLGQVRREEPEADLDQRVRQLLPRMKRRFSLKSNMTLKDFKSWYKKTTSRDFRAVNIDPEEVAPLAMPNAGLLRRMGIAVMLARERHLITLESRLLGEHLKVLVIYGSGHLVYQDAILKDMMGPPVHKSSRWIDRLIRKVP